MEPDAIVDTIKRAIAGDSTIQGADHILVFAQPKGFWPFRKTQIRLTGIVHQESDKKKAEEYAQQNAGDIPVESEIEVVPRRE